MATSYERIHRSNLVGMGVLPLQFIDGATHESLGLSGEESYSVIGLSDSIQPGQELILKADGKEIPVLCRAPEFLSRRLSGSIPVLAGSNH